MISNLESTFDLIHQNYWKFLQAVSTEIPKMPHFSLKESPANFDEFGGKMPEHYFLNKCKF